MSSESHQAVADFAELLGPSGWLSDADDTLKYRTPWRGGDVGDALGVARPDSTESVAAVLKLARKHGVAIVPQGGNTGLVLGSIPTERRPTVVLTLERMNRIRDIDAGNYALVAEAGCVIQRVQEAAADENRLFPLSLASEGSCTIGGTLSTNAGGNQTIRFGNAREQVLGLEVVLADGTVFEGLNTLRKNNTGYDLKHLFIGAEGTLGIITAAAIRLMPYPRVRETALLAVPDTDSALQLLNISRELSGDAVLAFELLPRYSLEMAMTYVEGCIDPLEQPSPWYILMELATSSEADDLRGKLEQIVEQAMEAGWVTDGVVAESEAQRAQLWRPREEQAEAARKSGRPSVGGDVSVPVARVAEFLRVSRERMVAIMPDVELNTFGHMGDGNIHYTARKPEAMDDALWSQHAPRLGDLLDDIVAEFGGSFSAEHGIGAMKREQLRRYAPEAKLGLMRAIKQAVDPEGLMNPGKIF